MCNDYIDGKLQNTYQVHTNKDFTQYKKDPRVHMSIEEQPTTNGNMEDCPNYTTKSEVTITTKSHQNFNDKYLIPLMKLEIP